MLRTEKAAPVGIRKPRPLGGSTAVFQQDRMSSPQIPRHQQLATPHLILGCQSLSRQRRAKHIAGLQPARLEPSNRSRCKDLP